MTAEIKSYLLVYPAWPGISMFFDLCETCLGKRLAGGASMLEKRQPVTKTVCADCVVNKAKGRV